jgi:hypothetical protein
MLIAIVVIGGVVALLSIADGRARASAWRRIAVERRRIHEQRAADEGDDGNPDQHPRCG